MTPDHANRSMSKTPSENAVAFPFDGREQRPVAGARSDGDGGWVTITGGLKVQSYSCGERTGFVMMQK